MSIGKIIKKYYSLIRYLETSRQHEIDTDIKFLKGALKNILKVSLVSLAIFFSKELLKINTITYKMDSGNISIPLNRNFLERSIRRNTILDAWGQFEYFFSQKIPNSSSMKTQKIIKEYYSTKSIPIVIMLFKEVRNSVHNNFVYNHNKKRIKCQVKDRQYELIPGQTITQLDHKFVLDVIEESLKLI